MESEANRETVGASWKWLYTTGGIAALLAAIVFRRNWAAEYSLLRTSGVIGSGPETAPGDVLGWFTLFQENPLVALILMGFVDVINLVLVVLIYLALFVALHQAARRAMMAAVVLGLTGGMIYFAANQAFEMFSLSRQYAGAGTAQLRDELLAAGQASLAVDNPGALVQGSSYLVSLFLVTTAGLIIAIVMLRSPHFGKTTSVIGILAHVLMLLYFPVLFTAPELLAAPPSLSAVFLLAWYILVGIRLIKLGRQVSG